MKMKKGYRNMPKPINVAQKLISVSIGKPIGFNRNGILG